MMAQSSAPPGPKMARVSAILCSKAAASISNQALRRGTSRGLNPKLATDRAGAAKAACAPSVAAAPASIARLVIPYFCMPAPVSSIQHVMGPDSLQNPVGKSRRSLLGSLTKQRRSGKNKSAKNMLPKLLFQGVGLPGWGALTKKDWAACGFEAVIANREEYDPADISYFCSFRPTPGLIKSLPNLKVIFSMGAGVDGFLRDPELPRHLPLVRFVDPTLIHEMAQYVVMHILMVHRGQRFFDSAQKEGQWRQRMLERPSRDTRIGMLGLGDIGTAIAESLLPFDFQLSGWSRTRKTVPGVKSFAGEKELPQFLSQCDYCVCVLPLTKDTQGVLNAKL